MLYDLCAVCGEKYNEAIAIDKRLRNTLERENFTGNVGICDKHRKMHEEGYLALIAVNPKLSKAERAKGTLNPKDAHCTGVVCHIKKSAWEAVIDNPFPELPFVYCDEEVINKLKELQSSSENPN